MVHLTFCFNYLLTQKNRKMSIQKFATNALHAGHDVSQKTYLATSLATKLALLEVPLDYWPLHL